MGSATGTLAAATAPQDGSGVRPHPSQASVEVHGGLPEDSRGRADEPKDFTGKQELQVPRLSARRPALAGPERTPAPPGLAPEQKWTAAPTRLRGT